MDDIFGDREEDTPYKDDDPNLSELTPEARAMLPLIEVEVPDDAVLNIRPKRKGGHSRPKRKNGQKRNKKPARKKATTRRRRGAKC